MWKERYLKSSLAVNRRELTDIILDTNAFRIFIDEKADEFIKRVVERCDIIYVPSGIDKELKTLFPHLFRKALRELGKRKMKEENLEVERLPDLLKRALEECNASPFDMKVAELAYRRRELGQAVYLVSNDRCFHLTRSLFEEEVGVNIRRLDEFESEYLAPTNS
jgi:rRNA-processing protein FCF1